MFSLYIIYIFLLLWAVHVTQRIFYSLYFWQLKEYRVDRVKGDIKKSLIVFLPKTAVLAVLLLLFSSLLSEPKDVSSWEDLVLIIFSLFGIYSLFLLFRKKWRIPKFTKKAILLLIVAVVLLAYSTTLFANSFFLFIVCTEIVLSSATFLLVQMLQIPTFFGKRIIYKKAKDKIEQHKGLTVIGITGSYGKSSTKEFLFTILSKKYKVLKTSGNINTEIGVAQTVINNLKPEHQIFIVEMGAYRKGEIKLMCDIVKPKIGIVTGVNEQHMALFGSLENLLSAEGGKELADALPKNGVLVLNGDNKHCLNLYKRTGSKEHLYQKIYSLSNKIIDSDIWSDSITAYKDHVSFLANDKSGELAHFNVNVLGKQNVQNLLGAILIAKEMGMNLGDISEACKDILQEQAGTTLKQGKHDIDIIDSSYSSNPDGVFADLDYLSIFLQKKVIVMPCIIELGKESARIHEKIGKKIGKVCDLVIVTNKDNLKEIKEGAVEAGMSEKDIILCDNPNDIYSIITLFCKKGDAVLLEGRVPSRLLGMLIN